MRHNIVQHIFYVNIYAFIYMYIYLYIQKHSACTRDYNVEEIFM